MRLVEQYHIHRFCPIIQRMHLILRKKHQRNRIHTLDRSHILYREKIQPSPPTITPMHMRTQTNIHFHININTTYMSAEYPTAIARNHCRTMEPGRDMNTWYLLRSRHFSMSYVDFAKTTLQNWMTSRHTSRRVSACYDILLVSAHICRI